MKHLQRSHNITKYDHDVVVVGCGPTGATLANLLALSGVNVLVIDREPNVYNLPRAVHFDDETMRVFQAVGIADALTKKTRVNPGMRFVDDAGEALLDWPRPEGIGRHGWHASYRLHQPDLENLLRNALTRYKHCTLSLGTRLLEIEQDDLSVNVLYQDVVNGQTLSCRAKYVVGCDGANSLVRSLMQTDMEDLGFKERWLVVDMLLKCDMPQLGDYTVQYCSAEQPMTYCRNPGQRRRWEMALPERLDDEQALDTQRIWSMLDRWIHPHQAELERKAIYTFRSMLANQWRLKRVLIAGDAAHLTPPFMGQGMCAGIRDASNLAWKLAMCVHEKSADTILDSYQQERHFHVREYITTAIRLGGLIISLDRNAALSLASNEKSSNTRMASIAPTLGTSALVPDQLDKQGHVGSMLEQPLLPDGSLLDDLFGYSPILIIRDKRWAVETGKGQVEIAIVSATDHAVLTTVLDKLKVNAVLVRPDRYILATADNETDASALNWHSLLSTH